MPRIENQFLDVVFYLYPSQDAAEVGEAIGGTGFLVFRPSDELAGKGYVYAVTNRHVVRDCASPIVRLNTKEGVKRVLPLTGEHWWDHPTDDLSVAHLGGINPEIYQYSVVKTSSFLTEKIIDEEDIGPGDEVFMAGRFVNHEGKQRNLPLLRFGNISMMPYEPILDDRGYEQESYLVEVRSLAGFSGSPVFVYIPSFTIRPKDLDKLNQGQPVFTGDTQISMRGPWLLGVHNCDLPFREPVKQLFKLTNGSVETLDTEYVAYSNSGQMTVIPSWRLLDFIDNDERFVMARKETDEKFSKQKASPMRPRAASDGPNEMTKTDFEDALKKASRKTSEPES
jgi:hypothetical protein